MFTIWSHIVYNIQDNICAHILLLNWQMLELINYKSDVQSMQPSARLVTNWPNLSRLQSSLRLQLMRATQLILESECPLMWLCPMLLTLLLWHQKCHSVKITLPSHPVRAFPNSQNLAKIPQSRHACGQNSPTCWNCAPPPPLPWMRNGVLVCLP